MNIHRIIATAGCALATLSSSVHGAPLVVAFERFHASQSSADGGRLLYNELGCVNCHGGDTGLPPRRGPDLAGIIQRAKADWLRAFLANPAAMRAGTTMPHLLNAGDVEPVVSFLATLKPKPGPKPKAARHVNAARGSELFHTTGCVSCHAPSGEFTPPEGAPKEGDFTHPSVAFPAIGEKYVLSSLADFIRDPLATRPEGRMPRFAMDEQDALDLAGHLLRYEGSDGQVAPKISPIRVDGTLAGRGREIVAAARCAACHTLPPEAVAPPFSLRKHEGGCLDANAPAGTPRYDLSAPQRASLRLFLTQRDTPAGDARTASLTLDALNCLACHERNGHGGPDAARKAYFQGDHNLGDTGRYPPPLTGIGRKLEPAWLAKVLTGEFRVRPYLQTKMPVYGGSTAHLGELLTKADGRKEAPLPGGDDTAGRKLLGTLGGYGCITCHRWGTRPSLGIQGPDLSNLGQRIQPGWLAEYLVNPAAHRPGTLMPSFWPGGVAANREILGGDTAKQIASIYSFAKSANGEPEGFPEKAGGEFELVPKDRPIVQRTFMDGAGTHAILVGFPQGVHVAYDGKNARPALAWRGRFFDAYNTWFSRFAPFEKPPGVSVVNWPAPPADTGAQFLGYRLDAKGVPTFLWLAHGLHVRERFEPVEGGLRRILNWDSPATNPRPALHPDGVKVTEESTAPGERIFIYSWK